jgi:hypothetical protein
MLVAWEVVLFHILIVPQFSSPFLFNFLFFLHQLIFNLLLLFSRCLTFLSLLPLLSIARLLVILDLLFLDNYLLLLFLHCPDPHNQICCSFDVSRMCLYILRTAINKNIHMSSQTLIFYFSLSHVIHYSSLKLLICIVIILTWKYTMNKIMTNK